MFGILFCFNGRIGRLKFFLNSFIFVPLAIVAIALVAPFIAVFGFHAGGSKWDALIFTILIVGALLWVLTSLQAARLRDMGWRPLPVITAIILLDVADLALAYFFPSLALAGKHFTGISSFVNTGFTLVLLFTPGTDDDFNPTILLPDVRLPRMRMDFLKGKHSGAPQPAVRSPAMARAPQPAGAGSRATFGRRGLD